MKMGVFADLPVRMQEKYGGMEGQVLKACPKCGDATVIVRMITPASVPSLKEEQLERDIRAIRSGKKYQDNAELYEAEIDAMRLEFAAWRDAYEGGFEPFCAPCTRPCACGLCD